ncbi:Eukaryotic-type carbonic anhydrase, partial [Sarracenia purpurea var. burkii]
EVEGNPPPDSSKTYGGVLCNETYIFRKVIFYQTKDLKGRSFAVVDGSGSPLTLALIYFNKQYGTFENSLKYRNGLVIETFQIDFLPVDNPLFYPVEFLLNLVRKPGSFVYAPAAIVYGWFDRLPLLNEYYAAYGSYINPKTGKAYECATYIVAPRSVHVISRIQVRVAFFTLWHV